MAARRKPRTSRPAKASTKAPRAPAEDGEAVWLTPYELRPTTRAALLATLQPLEEARAGAALASVEGHLAEFFAFRRAGEFKLHAIPTGEQRRSLERFAAAADAYVLAAAAYAEAAAALGEEARYRVGAARLDAAPPGDTPDRGRDFSAVVAELREAEREPQAEHVATVAALADSARYALSALSREVPRGRGPKPNLEAEFLIHRAALVWEEFTGTPAERAWHGAPEPFLPFVLAVFRVAGVQLDGVKRPGEKLLRRFMEVWPAAKRIALLPDLIR